MVAPVNATAQIDLPSGAITLTLNFATLSAANKAGVNVFKDDLTDPFKLVPFLVALAKPAHPDFTSDQGFALVMKNGEAVGDAMAVVFEEFGQEEEAGNAPEKPRAKKAV